MQMTAAPPEATASIGADPALKRARRQGRVRLRYLTSNVRVWTALPAISTCNV